MKKKGIGVTGVFSFDHRLNLGDVTPYYLELCKLLNDYHTFETLRYHLVKIEAIELQKMLSYQYRNRLSEQLSILEEDMEIELRNYTRDTALHRINVITSVEVDQSHSRLLQKKHSLTNAKINLENVQMELNQMQISCIDLQKDYQQQKQQFNGNISRALDGLNNQLENWMKNYTFRSPHEGIVTFTNIWANNQFSTEGLPIMSILPLKEEKIIGKMEIPIARSGKICEGLNVIIKLDNYPYMEFGVIRGVITSISLVPVNDLYFAEIELPNSLNSNYDITIPFNQEMCGAAEIIIEDISLFERFLQPVRSAIKRK